MSSMFALLGCLGACGDKPADATENSSQTGETPAAALQRRTAEVAEANDWRYLKVNELFLDATCALMALPQLKHNPADTSNMDIGWISTDQGLRPWVTVTAHFVELSDPHVKRWLALTPKIIAEEREIFSEVPSYGDVKKWKDKRRYGNPCARSPIIHAVVTIMVQYEQSTLVVILADGKVNEFQTPASKNWVEIQTNAVNLTHKVVGQGQDKDWHLAPAMQEILTEIQGPLGPEDMDPSTT